MAEHIVRAFGEALDQIAANAERMGQIAVAQISDALRAMEGHDEMLARRVVERDVQLDELEAKIGHDAIRLIALRQPMAGDLRRTLAAIKIAGNLERCGDLAKSIAKRTLAMGHARADPPLAAEVQGLGRLAAERLERVVRAYVEADAHSAMEVWRADTAIDDAFDDIFRGLVQCMSATPSAVTDCAHLLFVAKNLERIGDHATNVAELVIYQVTGDEMSAVARPRGAAA